MRAWPPLLLLLAVALAHWATPSGGHGRELQYRPGGAGVDSKSARANNQPDDGSPTDHSGTVNTLESASDHATSKTCSPCRCYPDKGGLVADCSRQNLTSIPPSIPNDTTTFNLTLNHLSIKNNTFFRFRRLRVLDLSANGIQNISKGAFHGLDTLEVLLLHGNGLNYTSNVFMPDIFKPLQNLRHLTLHGNTKKMEASMDYPDLALSHLPLLQSLTLDGLTNKSFGPGFRDLDNLTSLSLSGFNSHEAFCELDSLFNDTFVNLTALQEINLSKCFLQFIENGSFLPLERIHTIDLSMNRFLGFDNLERASYGFQNRTIRFLKASHLYEPYHHFCIFARRHHFQYLKHVEEIDLSYNMIVTFEQGALHPLSENVRVLYAQGSLMYSPEFLFELLVMKNLTALDLSYKWYTEIQDTNRASYEKEYSRSFVSNPREATCHTQPFISTRMAYQKYLQTSALQLSQYRLYVPQNLRVIRISGRLLDELFKGFNLTSNSIEEVDFSDNLLTKWIGPIQGLDNLRFANLSRNRADYMAPTFLSVAPNIEVLDVSFNLLADEILKEENIYSLANLTSLRILNISHNKLYTFPDGLTQGLPAIEQLIIHRNRLEMEGFRVNLRPWKKLRYLDLNNNYLASLLPEIRTALDALASEKNHSISVDLTENPLRCECGNMDFLRWLRSTPVVLVSREKLRCVTANESKAVVWEALELLESQCMERAGLFLAAVLSSLVIVAAFAGLVVYRVRWKLRYCYYAARDRYRRLEGAQVHYRYDAFISYASEDYEWVRGQLQQRLEQDHGLRLCLHQRDFLAGTPIAANIVEAVQLSRRTVCVLSQNFLDSHWCKYELQMAKMEGLHTGRDVVLLLLYDPTIKRSLPQEILYYILSDSYLEYPREQEAFETFWSNLVLALKRS